VELPASKKNKLLIWKAYYRATSQLIDWECGNCNKATHRRLLDRLKRWNIWFFLLTTGFHILRKYHQMIYFRVKVVPWQLRETKEGNVIGLQIQVEINRSLQIIAHGRIDNGTFRQIPCEREH